MKHTISIWDLPNEQKRLRLLAWDKICQIVCNEYGVTQDDIVGRSNIKKVTHPRFIATILAKDVLGASLQELQAFTNRKQHTSVLRAIERGRKYIKLYPENAKAYARIIEQIKNSYL